jgi:hypothetical protein
MFGFFFLNVLMFLPQLAFRCKDHHYFYFTTPVACRPPPPQKKSSSIRDLLHTLRSTKFAKCPPPPRQVVAASRE